jgi:signal transduction histidine kinase
MYTLGEVRHPRRMASATKAISPAAGSSWGRGHALRSLARGATWRTVRFRLTALYGGLFLLCGAALLAITYLLVRGAPFAPPPGYNPPGVSGNEVIGAAAERHAVLHTLLTRFGIALAIMTVVSIGLGWIVAGRVLAPLRVITSKTRRISHESLHERLALEGPADEIKQLGDTIDDLLARLEAAFEAQRRFMANVAHELRTPHTMMRTSLDVAAGKPGPISDDAQVLSGKLREGLDQADRLVESFLTLARAESGGVTDAEPVQLPGLVRSAVAARREAIDELDLDLDDRLGAAPVSGNDLLLRRLVANLVDNAIRHNQAGGFISLTTQADGSTACLIVANSGTIMTPDEVTRLLEPFHRHGADRTAANGVGLGLPIVAAIARAHGGQLTLGARAQGGLVATVELPSATSAAPGAPS